MSFYSAFVALLQNERLWCKRLPGKQTSLFCACVGDKEKTFYNIDDEVGVIAVETRPIDVHLPADPANPNSEAKIISQAGQVRSQRFIYMRFARHISFQCNCLNVNNANKCVAEKILNSLTQRFVKF